LNTLSSPVVALAVIRIKYMNTSRTFQHTFTLPEPPVVAVQVVIEQQRALLLQKAPPIP
jgi:hypothetical protein